MEKELLTIDTALQFLIKEFEEIAGEWNGDESGLQEERSTSAKEIAEKAQELRGLLDDFNDL